jgi:transcriptional regulator GlxA family with amidase domain
MSDRLGAPHSVATLAQRAHMSTRTFARRFVAETGVTPMQWLIAQRVLHARLASRPAMRRSRRSPRPAGSAARRCSGTTSREVGIAPSAYRRSYACDASAVDPDPVSVATPRDR